MTSPSPKTSTTALTQAPHPWKIARNANCGRNANAKRMKYTRKEITERGNSRPKKSGQNSLLREKYQIPRIGYEAATPALWR